MSEPALDFDICRVPNPDFDRVASRDAPIFAPIGPRLVVRGAFFVARDLNSGQTPPWSVAGAVRRLSTGWPSAQVTHSRWAFFSRSRSRTFVKPKRPSMTPKACAALARTRDLRGFFFCSSRLLRKEFADPLKRYYGSRPVLWSRSYCILTVGTAPLSVLKQYIEQRDRPRWRRLRPMERTIPTLAIYGFRSLPAPSTRVYGRLPWP